MRRLFFLAALLLLAPLAAQAQVFPAPPNVGTAANRPVNCVASNPGQPQEPQWYFATDTSTLSICVATNTWQNTGGGGGGTIGGSGTPGTFTEWQSSNFLQNAPMLDLTGITESTNPTVINGALMFPCTNSASGTTNGLLVSLDANGNCINLPNGQTGQIDGVMFSGAGTSGIGFEAKLGPTPLTFDNQTVINDYVVAGANSQAHDAGATYPTGVQVIGIVKSANSGTGTSANVNLDILNTLNPQGSTGHTIQVNNVTTAGATDSFNATTPAAAANNQNLVFQTDNATPTSNISVEVPLATSSQPGLVQLSTDLGGSYTAPNVVGIQGIPCTVSGTPVAGQVWGFNSPTACGNIFLGVAVRTVSSNSDPIVSTDRETNIRYTAASGATSVALPQAGSAGFTANIAFVLTNAQGSGDVTVTPTTSTINGAATLVIHAGNYAFFYSDNTNYFANGGTISGSSGVTSVATTSPITGGTITGTGTIGCASCVTESTGGAVPTSAHLLGTSSAPNLQAATRTDIDAIGYVAGGGSANAQTATLAPAVGSLTNGLTVCWLPTAANTTTTPTLAVNGLAAKTLVKVGLALVANDLTTTAIACAIYDGTNFELQNPQTGVGGSVTQSVPGEFKVNGSSSSTSSTLAITKANENPNLVWAGPISSGSSNLVQSASGTSTTSPLAVAYPSNNSAGNLLVAVVAWGNSGLALADSAGDSWTHINAGSFGSTLDLYYTCSAVGGANTVTATVSTAFLIGLQIYEFSGNATTSCLDASGTGSGSSTATSYSISTSGSVSQSTELVLGFLHANHGTVANIFAGPNYSPLLQTTTTAFYQSIARTIIGNATTGLSGTQTATFTTDLPPADFNDAILTFKLNTTGGAQPAFRSLVCQDYAAHTPCGIFRTTLTGQSSAITDTAMIVVGSSAQLYRFTGEINCDTTVSTATATLNLKWTDTSNTAQTLSAATLCSTLGSASVANIVVAIRAKAATTITYGVTIANSPNYDVDVFLEQMN